MSAPLLAAAGTLTGLVQPVTTGIIDLTSLDSDGEQDDVEDDAMHDLADLPVRPERRSPPEDDLEDLPLARRLPAKHAIVGFAAASRTSNSMCSTDPLRRSQPRSRASDGTVQTILDAFPSANTAQTQRNGVVQSEPKAAAVQRQPQRGVTSLGQPKANQPAAKPAQGLGHQDISKLWPDGACW